MIRKAFKEFFTNGRSFLISCGVIYLSLIIILSSFAGTFMILMKSISQETILQIETYNENFFAALESSSFDISSISNYFKEIFEILSSNLNSFKNAAIFVSIISIIFLACGITYASHLCGKNIKEEGHNVSFMKTFGVSLCRFFIVSIFLSLYIFIASNWKYNIIFLIIFAIIFMICENLFSTWLLYFNKKPLKKYLNLKNIFSLLLSYILILLCLSLVVIFSFVFLGTFISLMIILPLISYTIGVMDAVSKTYFDKHN